MGTDKATRLSKLAREFNVGISTIVEFLHKKGYDIDSNPNTKVSEELYDILVEEYKSDLNVKKESEKLSLNQLRSKKETISINDVEEEEDEDFDEEESEDIVAADEILIKDVSSSSKPITPQPKEEVKEKIEKVEEIQETKEEPVQETITPEEEVKPVKEEVAEKEEAQEEVQEGPNLFFGGYCFLHRQQ